MERNLIGKLSDVKKGDYISLHIRDESVKGMVMKLTKRKIKLYKPSSDMSTLREWNLGYRTFTGLFSKKKVVYDLGNFERCEVHPFG